MEKAMQMLAGEADGMDEEDPRQAAGLMQKLSDMTGLQLGPGMREALERLRRGEDPEAVEADMEDVLENEDPFVMPARKGAADGRRNSAPRRDETLYDL
jgi:hypothetical protein